MQHATQEAVPSFDSSLDTLDIALRAPDGRWPIPHRPYTNNRSGFQQLKGQVRMVTSPCLLARGGQ
jgi:hypothetical protein